MLIISIEILYNRKQRLQKIMLPTRVSTTGRRGSEESNNLDNAHLFQNKIKSQLLYFSIK